MLLLKLFLLITTLFVTTISTSVFEEFKNEIKKSKEKYKKQTKEITIIDNQPSETTLSVNGLLGLFDGDRFSIPTTVMSSEHVIALFTGFGTVVTGVVTVLGILLMPLQIADQFLAVVAVAMMFAYASDVTGLTDALDERYSKHNSENPDQDILSAIHSKLHEGTLLEDEFVSNHLTDDYDFRDNLIYTYRIPSYMEKIALTAMKTAMDTGATVWNTTFETARSFSNSAFGQDVSTLASRVYNRYMNNL